MRHTHSSGPQKTRQPTRSVLLSVESLESRIVLDGDPLEFFVDPTASLAPPSDEGTIAEAVFEIQADPRSADQAYAKLDSTLQSVAQDPNVDWESGPASSLQVSEDFVAVEVAASQGLDALLADLQPLGFVADASFEFLVSGWLPMDQLAVISQLESVQFVASALEPIRFVGSVTSQGDPASNADLARSQFNVDGSGVTVGILSDSFDRAPGSSYAADVASGDLPDDVTVLQEFPFGTDEGRAMAQLVADIAPGADLAFTTAFGGITGFANGILNLAAFGADVIVDDVINLREPMFQDGLIAQAVDQVVAQGVSYFSSAGNQGANSYQSQFVDSGTNLVAGNVSLGDLHDFDPGAGVDFSQSISVPVGSTFQVSFQWDEPFFSVSGGLGSQSDYDIYLVSGSSIAAAATTNNLGGDAVEILTFENTGQFGSQTQFELFITRVAGSDNLLKYVDFSSQNVQINEYLTGSPTLFGHANATGAQAVGAAFFGDTPRFGQDPAEVEPFSALGGVPILFDTDGNRLETPEIRQKPELVGPDGANTTFFGTDISSDADSFPNFFGTSAAAPHVAAVAALMLQADPSLTPDQVYQILQETAQEIGPAGPDAISGFGLVDALAAVGVASGSIDSPTAASDAFTVNEDSGLTTFEVLANDQDGGGTLAIISASSGSAGGSVTINNGQSINYQPAANFFGTETFSYTIENAAGQSTATVTVSVLPINDLPTAVDDSFTVIEGSQGTPFEVLANDSITPDTGETLTVVSVGTGSQGGTITTDGQSVTYTPQAGFSGTESFTYTVNDGTPGGDATATVTVTVLADGDFINFNEFSIDSYGGSNDDTGPVTIEDNGATLRLAGNRWKKIDFPYEVTANTILEFDFSSSSQGEIHGIGFDDDTAHQPNRTFQVYGTQDWGILDFADYADSAPEVRRYTIRVGDFYTGQMNHLFFTSDDDANVNSESIFSNIRVYEETTGTSATAQAETGLSTSPGVLTLGQEIRASLSDRSGFQLATPELASAGTAASGTEGSSFSTKALLVLGSPATVIDFASLARDTVQEFENRLFDAQNDRSLKVLDGVFAKLGLGDFGFED